MKTKLLFLIVLIMGISLKLLHAQSDEKRAPRPFAERIYGEYSFGLFRPELTNSISNLAIGYRITPNVYLGIEHIPRFGSSNMGNSYGVSNGWGLQSQIRLGKWYAFAGFGYLGDAGYGDDGPQWIVSDDPPDDFSYYRYGMKYCFNQWFSLGFQYAESDHFTGYRTDDPPEEGEPVSYWSHQVKCFTINIGVMIQKVPKKTRKD
ncbi:MAG: hypothetical protein NXI25_16985 [bacterium]|nr:hypothetical protein [bacterium]